MALNQADDSVHRQVTYSSNSATTKGANYCFCRLQYMVVAVVTGCRYTVQSARSCVLSILWLGVFILAADAQAQKPGMPRIGVLLVGGYETEGRELAGFQRGLREAGYVEGTNIVIEWRFANGEYGRALELAADLVRSNVDVMVADVTVAARAAVQATSTIPIVMATVADPIGSGL